MNEVEKKLSAYRAQKESLYFKFKTNLNLLFSAKKKEDEDTPLSITQPLIAEENIINNIRRPSVTSDKSINSDLASLNDFNEMDDTNCLNCCSYMDWFYYSLWFILWATIYLIFIKIQFGTVYLIGSLLIGIYYNTRTEPKKAGEISAYSVFNKDCKSIDGTLKAEQFEREIRYGPAMVR
ncbi:hypothetical protein NQ317_010696 [Molorchus minor]|uniref:SAYSvFN domain-containing protein n=1 Tax=Molorchus minor TaxID=1323400 RepID=A0ABQ9K6K2_9CUCU|nr:hypothetical protein NQ317_010696 [Molorchus minor]